jgi:hypothetical protein
MVESGTTPGEIRARRHHNTYDDVVPQQKYKYYVRTLTFPRIAPLPAGEGVGSGSRSVGAPAMDAVTLR